MVDAKGMFPQLASRCPVSRSVQIDASTLQDFAVSRGWKSAKLLIFRGQGKAASVQSHIADNETTSVGQVRRGRRQTSQDVCGASIMENSRIPIPRRKKNEAIIEAFQCSRCEWEYVLRKQEPDVIAYDEVARAAWKFDAHSCELYRPREIAKGASVPEARWLYN